jgi:hypothetical protein
MKPPLHSAERPPPENEAARPPRHGSAEPRASINSRASKIVASAGRRKRGIAVSRPSDKAIKAAMRFLAPWGSR